MLILCVSFYVTCLSSLAKNALHSPCMYIILVAMCRQDSMSSVMVNAVLAGYYMYIYTLS